MVGRGFWVGVAGRGLKEGMKAKQGWPSSSTGGNPTHKELKGHLGSWSASLEEAISIISGPRTPFP